MGSWVAKLQMNVETVISGKTAAGFIIDTVTIFWDNLYSFCEQRCLSSSILIGSIYKVSYSSDKFEIFSS